VTPLLLVGAGGFARETAEAVRAVNDVTPRWRIVGFLDDAPGLGGTSVDGLPVLGPVDRVADFPDAAVAVCVASHRNQGARRVIVQRLGLASERYATIVHPAAVVPPATELGAGSILLAGVTLTTAVRVGAHVQMMPQVVVTHDDVIGDYATFGAGVRLAGNVVIGEGAYVGSAAAVREGLTVGAWSLVGMGSVVLHDVPDNEVWAGVPARAIRSRAS
jgi:sugar O-acyltransferase (sialic acid O-acetyltransferase NeuD family)